MPPRAARIGFFGVKTATAVSAAEVELASQGCRRRMVPGEIPGRRSLMFMKHGSRHVRDGRGGFFAL